MNGMEIRKILGKNIRSYRESRLWSQADLAEYSEISIPFLSEIERGNKWPYPDTLGKIANAFDLRVHDLFREESALSVGESELAELVIKEIIIAQKAIVERVTKQYLGKTITY